MRYASLVFARSPKLKAYAESENTKINRFFLYLLMTKTHNDMRAAISETHFIFPHSIPRTDLIFIIICRIWKQSRL